MPHQQAILVAGPAVLGTPGGEVTIATVEANFTTSATANHRIKYRCTGCPSDVYAVVPRANVPGRKQSPSAHFKVHPTLPHAKGCRPAPMVVTTTGVGGSLPAHTTKAAYPTTWHNPAISGGSGATPPTTVVPGGSGSSGSSGGRTRSGSGTSATGSKLVEPFARGWLTMTPAARRGAPLGATWNSGGTYDSAFFDLHAHTVSATPTSGEHIFHGEVLSQNKFPSGYVIKLKQKHADGSPLEIWVQPGTQTNSPAGATLWAKLAASVPPGSKVFVHGQFMADGNGAKRWYSLPVTQGEDVWIY